MKRTKKIIAKAIKATAEKSLKRNAEQTTCTIFFQPKAPDDLKRFKKNRR